jgi:hypothetical protein
MRSPEEHELDRPSYKRAVQRQSAIYWIAVPPPQAACIFKLLERGAGSLAQLHSPTKGAPSTASVNFWEASGGKVEASMATLTEFVGLGEHETELKLKLSLARLGGEAAGRA